jgi:lipid-A-disaccharide synthase
LLVGGQAPDLLILIDFPEFNLRLAKAAKNQDLPVLYYVSPQIWAWRRGRIRKISRIVDKLAVILPFEVNLYKPYGLDAQYVGNPLVDDFKVTQSREEFRAAHDIGADVPLVGLFPGSRRSELRHIFPTIRQAAEKILAQKPECRFLLPVAPSLENVNLREYAGVDLHQIIYVEGENIYAAANACDAIVCVSGTVTLQIALTGTPMVIVYKLSPLTYWLGRLLIRVPFIGLANIVAGKQIAREFIQDMANPGNIASEILRILEEPKYNQEIRQAMGEIREKLGPGGCSERVARLASAMTQTRTSF